MHGGFWRGKGAGTLGDIGCFSFQSSKLMTCGEGGIIITDDDALEERCQAYVNSGRGTTTDRQAAEGTMLGWNYRMTEFQAAVLLAQLERLPEQIATPQRATSPTSSERVAGIEGVSTLPARRPHDDALRLRRRPPLRRDRVARRPARPLRPRALRRRRASSTPPSTRPSTRRPLFAWKDAPIDVDYCQTHCPVAERAADKEMIWLPHEVFLGTTSDVDDIITAIEKLRAHLDETHNSHAVRRRGGPTWPPSPVSLSRATLPIPDAPRPDAPLHRAIARPSFRERHGPSLRTIPSNGCPDSLRPGARDGARTAYPPCWGKGRRCCAARVVSAPRVDDRQRRRGA